MPLVIHKLYIYIKNILENTVGDGMMHFTHKTEATIYFIDLKQ